MTGSPSAFDLNAGLEFRISKKPFESLEDKFNNIFNKQYQRWNQYPVFMGSTLSAESYFRSTKRTSMYVELYEYLILHRQLHLSGIGTFLLETKPSVTDLSYRQMNALVYSVSSAPRGGAALQTTFSLAGGTTRYWLQRSHHAVQ